MVTIDDDDDDDDIPNYFITMIMIFMVVLLFTESKGDQIWEMRVIILFKFSNKKYI
jgi:hypothetical protein